MMRVNMMRANTMMTISKAATTHPTSTWHHQAWQAMNTTVHLSYAGGDTTLGDFIVTLFDRSEHYLSRFRPESELCRLNRSTARTVPLSLELYNAIDVALWAVSATNGLYNPTLLCQLEQAGYDRSFELVDRQKASPWPARSGSVRPPGQACASRRITLDRRTRALERPPGTRLDLGGMGKGWTVDRAADLLHRHGPFLLNAGGDLYAHGYPDEARGWEIEIEDPQHPTRHIGRMYVANTAVATSSLAKRHWLHNGQVMHHIIDPRTGRPAKTDVLAVTMLADRTVTAEIHAKAVLILGVEEGLRYLAQRPALEGLIIDRAGDIHLTPGLLARDLDLTPGSTSDAAGILPSIPDYSIPDHVERDSHAT